MDLEFSLHWCSQLLGSMVISQRNHCSVSCQQFLSHCHGIEGRVGGGAKKMRIRTPHCQRIHVTMQMLSPSEVRVEREGPLQVFQSRCHSWPLTPCPSYWLVLWRNGTLFDIWETVCSLALSLQTSPDNLK